MIQRFKDAFDDGHVYTFILGIMVVIYVAFQFQPKDHLDKQVQESEALREFRQAEKSWSEKVSGTNKEEVENYLRSKPVAAGIFNFLSFFVIGAFSVGLVLDFLFLFRPQWRRRVLSRGSPAHLNLALPMLFKVIVLWVGLSLILSMFFGMLQSTIFPSANMNFLALAHTTVMDLLCVLLILWVIKEKQAHWRDLGFWTERKNIFREIGVGLLGYMAVLPVFFIVLIFLIFIARLFAYEPPAHPLVEIFLEEEKRSSWIIVYSLFLASVLGPIIEEIFFRGFCYSILKNRWGKYVAMVISSMFFAFIHQNQFAFWPIFILGMGLAFLYETRRSLIAPITLHVSHNCFFITYFFLAKHMIQESGMMP